MRSCRLPFFALACWCLLASASALPARRALDTAPPDVNNFFGVPQLPKNDANVEATIKEVEKLLHADPTLPRLTRGEILDIIENLTISDVHSTLYGGVHTKPSLNVQPTYVSPEQEEGVDLGANRDKKAIMVVMPYSADSVQNGDVQSLYTKPPVTHIIGDDGEKEKRPEKKRRPSKKPYVPESNHLDYTSAIKVGKVPTTTEQPISLTPSFVEEQFQQQQDSSIEVATQKERTTTENPFTRFIRRRKTTKIPANHKPQYEEVTSLTSGTTSSTTTSTTTTTTTEVPRTRKRKPTRRPSPTTSTTTLETLAYVPDGGINIVDPPSFHSHNQPAVNAFQPMPTSRPLPPMTTPSTTTTTSLPVSLPPQMVVGDVQIPEDFKEVLKNLDILIKQSPTEPPQAGITPLDQLSEQDKIRLLIASLEGMQMPPSTTTTTTTTTSTTAQPDVMQVANNLTPEMQELLMTFGLIPDPNKDKTTTSKPEVFMEPTLLINPDSYTNFKPLPSSANSEQPSEDMEDLLAKFGLVEKSNRGRGQKAISMSKPENNIPNVNLDVIPDKFKDLITEIGLENIKPPQSDSHQVDLSPISDIPIDVPIRDVPPKESEHVFNPSEAGTEYATQDEINRLNQLMAVIKQFEKLNGTTNEEDLKHVDLEGLKTLVNSFNVPLDEQKGPNPLDYDVGIIKNEVKRQTSTTETPSELQNPSLALLEDSFGGSSDTATEATTTTTEAPKRTGFYYLVDWNSFLDIDNQKGKRVNLRFQPKIGDPKRFFSVNVP